MKDENNEEERDFNDILKKRLEEFKDKDVCTVCYHKLSLHLDEGDGWRCHSLDMSLFQCECYLRKGRYDTKEEYNLGNRIKEQIDSN